MWKPGLAGPAEVNAIGAVARGHRAPSRWARAKFFTKTTAPAALKRFGGHLLTHKGKYAAGVGLAAAAGAGAYYLRRRKRRK